MVYRSECINGQTRLGEPLGGCHACNETSEMAAETSLGGGSRTRIEVTSMTTPGREKILKKILYAGGRIKIFSGEFSCDYYVSSVSVYSSLDASLLGQRVTPVCPSGLARRSRP